jgi:uncharacterized protein
VSIQARTATATADRSLARRGLLLFLALVAVFDAGLVMVIVRTGDTRWILALMWSVTAASVICRLALREGFRDVSFRFGGARTLVVVVAAVVFPIAVGAVAYGSAWASGLARFASPPGGFLAVLLGAATVGAVLSAISAAGEEIGWRGYMLTRLIEAGIPRPVLVSGLIWALWHVPLIVTGIYVADPDHSWLLTVPLFMISATSAAFLLARVRLATGSIWPAIALHAAWNSVIQAAFDRATTGADAALWTGEAGVLVVVVLVVAAVLVSLRPGRVLRSPGNPEG